MLTVSDVSVLLPGDVQLEAPRQGGLPALVVGEGEEGVPAVEAEGLRQVVDLPSQVDRGGVLRTGRVGTVPDGPDPLDCEGQRLPWLCLTSCRQQ